MADPQTTRSLIRRFQSLSEALRQSGYEPDGTVGAFNRSAAWVSSVWKQLESAEAREEAADQTWDAFTEYLVGSLGDLRRALERTGTTTLEQNPELVVCCILNALYEMSSDAIQEDVTDLRVKYIDERVYIAWLRTIREMLVLVRDLTKDGFFQFTLQILAFDLSNRIRFGLESAIIAPLIGGIYAIELAIEQALGRASTWLGRLRCTPIMELWGAVLSWLYTHQGGFIQRARGFLLKAMLRLHRTLLDISGEAGASIDGRVGDYDGRHIEYLIAIIDALLDAVRLLQTCRLPYYTDSEEDREETPRGSDDRPGSREDETTTEEGGTGSGDGEGGEGGSGGSTTPGGGSGVGTGGGTPTDTTGDGEGRRRRPAPGTSLDPAGFRTPGGDDRAPRYRIPDVPEGYVYLTTANVTELLIRHFSVAPERAVEVAEQQRCREELSPESRALLAELGVI